MSFRLIGKLAEYHVKAAELSIKASKELNKFNTPKYNDKKFYAYLNQSIDLKLEYDYTKWIYLLFYE